MNLPLHGQPKGSSSRHGREVCATSKGKSFISMETLLSLPIYGQTERR